VADDLGQHLGRFGGVKPQPKVAAGGIAGSLAVVVLLVARSFGVEMDAVEGGAIATLICFAASYLKS
jgi:hypothetical protein